MASDNPFGGARMDAEGLDTVLCMVCTEDRSVRGQSSLPLEVLFQDHYSRAVAWVQEVPNMAVPCPQDDRHSVPLHIYNKHLNIYYMPQLVFSSLLFPRTRVLWNPRPLAKIIISFCLYFAGALKICGGRRCIKQSFPLDL